MSGTAGTGAIAATVLALRAGAVAGIIDAIGEPGAIVAKAAERNRTFRVRLPGPPNASPPPSGLYAAVVAEWQRQCRRIDAAAAVVAAVRTQPRAELRPAVLSVVLERGGGAMVVDVAIPWTAAQKDALADLEREQRERAARLALAAGPDDVQVRIPLDGDGAPDLDGATIPDTAVRAAVRAALRPSASTALPMPRERAAKP